MNLNFGGDSSLGDMASNFALASPTTIWIEGRAYHGDKHSDTDSVYRCATVNIVEPSVVRLNNQMAEIILIGTQSALNQLPSQSIIPLVGKIAELL